MTLQSSGICTAAILMPKTDEVSLEGVQDLETLRQGWLYSRNHETLVMKHEFTEPILRIEVHEMKKGRTE